MLATYQYADKAHIAKSCQRGALALLGWMIDNVEGSSSSGCFNPTTIPGSTTYSLHAEGRAIDVHTPDNEVRARIVPMLEILVAHSLELGLIEVIHQKKIWSTAVDAGSKPFSLWRGLSNWQAVGDHMDHAHIGLTRDAAGNNGAEYALTLEKLDSILGPIIHPAVQAQPQGDDDMAHKIIAVVLGDPSRRDAHGNPVDPVAWARFFGVFDGKTVSSMHWLHKQENVNRLARLGYENEYDAAGKVTKENVLYIGLDSCHDIHLDGDLPYGDENFEKNAGRGWSRGDFLTY